MAPPYHQIVGDPAAGGPWVFTCEHAGRDLPPEWEISARDRARLSEHWGWDIGAADLTRALAETTGSCAVLCSVSRLVCDANRGPEEPSFVLESTDGEPLAFNRAVDAAERGRRRELYFDPYHAAVDRVLEARRAAAGAFRLCAIHSFTPVYAGSRRPMDVGVLFDDHDAHARALASLLSKEGFATALNEPYSGYEGLVYSAARHGRAHGLVYLELEVRQDLIDRPDRARAVGGRIARALERLPA